MFPLADTLRMLCTKNMAGRSRSCDATRRPFPDFSQSAIGYSKSYEGRQHDPASAALWDLFCSQVLLGGVALCCQKASPLAYCFLLEVSGSTYLLWLSPFFPSLSQRSLRFLSYVCNALYSWRARFTPSTSLFVALGASTVPPSPGPTAPPVPQDIDFAQTSGKQI